jgi:hypothetical protein
VKAEQDYLTTVPGCSVYFLSAGQDKEIIKCTRPSNGAGKVSHCQNIAEKIPRKNRQMSAFPGDKIS